MEGDEECDDGNDDNRDDCLNSCELPYCGDGITAIDEECDDGNQDPTDGCSACFLDRIVFITSDGYAGDLSGMVGAITACRNHAVWAGLSNADTYLPWLSDAIDAPATTFLKSGGRYTLPNGAVVAHNWNDLTDGTLDHSIDRNEDGDLEESTAVWTNTTYAGFPPADPLDCLGWNNSSFAQQGYAGSGTASDNDWSLFGNPGPCSSASHLYCFEN